MVQTLRFGLLVCSLILFTIFSIAAGAETGQARATRDVDRWKTQIEQTRENVNQLREQIYTKLPQVMDEEAEKVAKSLAEYREERSRDNRVQLQQTTINALMRVVGQTAPVLEQREDIQTQLTAVEEKAITRASAYRAESEQIDQALPARRAELEKLRLANRERKRNYSEDMPSRELERQLRAAYFAEKRMAHSIRFDELKVRQRVLAARKLQEKASEIQWLSDGIEDTFINLEFCQLACQENAELLSDQMDLEDELVAFGGTAELGELIEKMGDLTNKTERLDEALNISMEALLAPETDEAGGPLPLPDSDFQRWLDEF